MLANMMWTMNSVIQISIMINVCPTIYALGILLLCMLGINGCLEQWCRLFNHLHVIQLMCLPMYKVTLLWIQQLWNDVTFTIELLFLF